MTDYQELVHEEQYENFDIKLYFLPEYTTPDWYFESEEEKQELFQKIDKGILLYFCAKVTASKNGIKLSDDYLGSCCYESIKQFIEDPYYIDMRDIVIKEAKENIKKLCK